jgi:hypothetical protein
MKYKKSVHKATNSRKLTVMIYIINTSKFLHEGGYFTSIFRYHNEVWEKASPYFQNCYRNIILTQAIFFFLLQSPNTTDHAYKRRLNKTKLQS